MNVLDVGKHLLPLLVNELSGERLSYVVVQLRRTLGGYARHVNFSAVVVLGLGCEVNQIGGLMQEQKLAGRLRAMDIQEVGGTRKTVEAGIAFVKEALQEANRVHREPMPASELTVALQCGGSDGYSGVSANPALGIASDLLVRAALLAAGFHQHQRGAWRRRKHGRSS